MAVEPNLIGVPGLVVGLMSAALGLVIYFSRPDRRQNRLLALVLVSMGLGWGMVRGVRYLVAPPDLAYASLLTGYATWSIALYAYPVLLGTLNTPLAAPFRWLPTRIALGAAAAGVFATALFAPTLWFDGIAVAQFIPGVDAWSFRGGPLADAWNSGWVLLWLIAMVVAIDAHRRTESPTLRRQAFWFAAAFVTSDLILFVWIIASDLGVLPYLVVVWTPPFAYFINAILLAYGILRAQLFDIDIRLKWTIKRGAVAGVFIAVFVMVAQVAQEFLADELGWAMGGLAAGALVFVIAPLHRAAERVANAAMPAVHASPEYEAFRKVEVYKGALEEMLQGGALSPRDRSVLDGMRRRLGLSEATAHALERDATTTGAPAV